ncbi:hypothetical protein [Priestia filamentosa]|uniref:hypothetical protein n=1 Tax=Priestia filamentosa TaxID=1402861 RepID=UPI00397C24DE
MDKNKRQLRGRKVDINPKDYGITDEQVKNEIEYYNSTESDIDINEYDKLQVFEINADEIIKLAEKLRENLKDTHNTNVRVRIKQGKIEYLDKDII